MSRWMCAFLFTAFITGPMPALAQRTVTGVPSAPSASAPKSPVTPSAAPVEKSSPSPASQPVAGQPDPRKLEWLDAMNRQAFSLRQQNRLDLAETLRQRVVTEAKALLPPGERRVIAFQIDYVDLLLQMKKYDEAERQLLDADKAITDPSNPQAATVRRALIRLYEAWGKPERARAVQNRTTQPTR